MQGTRRTVMAVAALSMSLTVFWAADRDRERRFQQAVDQFETKGDVRGAIALFEEAAKSSDRNLAARAVLYLGQCHEKLGNTEARKAYERVVKDYGDQAEVARQAKERLTALARAAGPSPEDGLQGRRIIGPSYHLRGGVSRDGRYVAHCCMAVLEVATGREQRFSIKPIGPGVDTYTFEPRFSPDSEDIAYVAQGGDLPELRMVRRSGAGERVLFSAPDGGSISLVDWMPDGKELLVTLVREDKTTELALVPVAGGAPRRIKSSVSISEGRLSLDGKFLAYRTQAATTGGAWVTRVLALDDISDALLAERPANAWNIGWTQDGRFLFYSAADGSQGIWAVKVGGGKTQGLPERIVGQRIEESIQPAGLSRSGAFVYYKTLVDFQLHLLEIGPGPGALKPSRVLAAAMSPDWSPDGRYLAYASGAPGSRGLITVRTLATGEERTVWTGLPGAIMSLRWFPGQSALAAQGLGPEGGRSSIGLHRVDLVSGSLSNILLGQNWTEFGANPTFSADGKVVTYKAFDRTRQVSTLTRYNLETRLQEVLVEQKPPQYVSAFSVLSGTGQIAVACQEEDNTSSIHLLDAGSRQLRPIYRTPPGTFIPASVLLGWMPDGKSLLFASRRYDPQDMLFSLIRIAVPGGQVEKIFETKWIWQVRVHPSGRQVAIETRPPRMETWVVDNLFATAKE